MIQKAALATGQLLLGLVVLFCLSRSLLRALPGDPVQSTLAETGFKMNEAELCQELGLDQSWSASLATDFRQLLHLDFGKSLQTRLPLNAELGLRLKNTLLLSVVATLIALLIGIPLGIYSVVSPSWDRFCSGFGSLTAALPTSWIGPLLALFLGVWIPIFELTGQIALPALTLGIAISGSWARMVRERVREHWLRGSATAARARGVSRFWSLLKYAFAPGAGFLVAYFCTGLAGLLSGAFVTETLFSWDGIGSWMVESVLRRDYPVFQAAFFVTTLCSLLANRLGSLFAVWMDPRHD